MTAETLIAKIEEVSGLQIHGKELGPCVQAINQAFKEVARDAILDHESHRAQEALPQVSVQDAEKILTQPGLSPEPATQEPA